MNEMGVFTPPHSLSTPVLFLVFNRPDTTQIVFNEIRKAQPAKKSELNHEFPNCHRK